MFFSPKSPKGRTSPKGEKGQFKKKGKVVASNNIRDVVMTSTLQVLNIPPYSLRTDVIRRASDDAKVEHG